VIVNVRGANGAGKTFVVRQFISSGWNGTDFKSGDRVLGHFVNHGGYITLVVGSYYGDGSGGVDRMKNADEMFDVLEAGLLLADHVIFEGILVSTTFGKLGEWAAKHRNQFAIVHLDTSLNDCLRNIETRRARSGRDHKEPQSKEKIEAKIKAINGAVKRFRDEGFTVHSVSSATAAAFIHELLGLPDVDA
jgi:hypothetical protein